MTGVPSFAGLDFDEAALPETRERRRGRERRATAERRSGEERRDAAARRSGEDRRSGRDRRQEDRGAPAEEQRRPHASGAAEPSGAGWRIDAAAPSDDPSRTAAAASDERQRRKRDSRGHRAPAALRRLRSRRGLAPRLDARLPALRPRALHHDVRAPPVDDAPVRRLLHRRGVQRLLPAQPGGRPARLVDRLRPRHPPRLRLRPSAGDGRRRAWPASRSTRSSTCACSSTASRSTG